jgi:peptidoglycan/LPS O-acetylase OafA/YrhL
MAQMPTPSRVLGWDFLRGLCALAVCTYHLFLWMDIAALHTFGLFGVYLFFVLSGASLSYTYGAKFRSGKFSFTEFLVTRYFRLTPLYLVLMLLVLPWKLSREPMSAAFASKFLLNLLLLFGIYHPADQSMLIGGWSLGIEAIFYLLFPIMLWILGFRYLGWMVWLVLLVLQLVWIKATVGAESGYSANVIAYHHAPAFAAYFFGGCLIGNRQGLDGLNGGLKFSTVGSAILLCGFPLMVLVNTPDAVSVLTGWRGVLLPLMCFLMVASAGLLDITGKWASAAAIKLGNATYGLYLIHPVIFFGLSYGLMPRIGGTQWLADLPLSGRLLLTLAVMSGSFALALVSDRYFEQRVRLHVRACLDRPM